MGRQEVKIVTWNANGILKNQGELQVFLDAQKIDIGLISETHLTKQSHIKFRGYKIYHTIHPYNTARGGSAVIIKENITHYEETHYQTEEIQATAVSVKTGNYNFTVCAVYSPPRHNIRKEQYLDFLKSLGTRFIAGGDFNAKNKHWGSRLTTVKGKELLAAIQEYDCVCLSTGKPTYWPTDPDKVPDLLDFFISRKISTNYINLEECLDLSSDHSSIMLTLSENIIKKKLSPTLTNKTTNWEHFQTQLSNKIQLKTPIKNKKQLDMETEKLIIDIQQAAWNSTTIVQTKTPCNNYPKIIKELVTEKRKARKKWQQTRTPTDKNRLNNLTQKLRRKIQQIKNESISSYLKELTAEKDTNYSLWRVTKKLRKPITQIPPIKTANGQWARSSKHKAEVFANYLEETFQPYAAEGNQDLTTNIRGEEANIKLVTPKEIEKEIKNNINAKKSPGYDLITGEILKHLPKKAIIKITYLINATFRLLYVPAAWKVSEVIMLAKLGKPPNEVSSYRPISLLPIISKLYEKLLLKRLKPIIEEKQLIPTHQFGFRNKHSTIEQVHRIVNIIEKSLEGKKVCSAVFLDVAQAFDKVWHEGLFNKLEHYLPRQYSELIKSYILDRHFRVKYDNEYSNIKAIKAGVPQGSVLGPILYLIYTCDLPQPKQATVATFADDTAILVVDDDAEIANKKLQKVVNQINSWTKKWRIKLNESKSTYINFTNKKVNPLTLTLNNSNIPYANTAKYLGMNLDAKLRWKEHIKKKLEEIKLKLKGMYWLLGRRSQLSVYNKILLYRQVIKPIWMYGIQLWGCASKSNINKIQMSQNKILRELLNAPWYIRNRDIHKDLEMPTVRDEIKKAAQKHKIRLQEHVNTEAQQLLNTQGLQRRLKRIKPCDLI